MITRLFSSATTSAVFSTGELPSPLHGPLLQNVIVPRVVSCSMVPTIRKGDRLRLERGDALQAGDIVVFRHDGLFVCHRIERVESGWLVVRGDATDGPPERVGVRDVVGRVTAILRDGVRLELQIGVTPRERSRYAPRLARSVNGLQEQTRRGLRTVVRSLLGLPYVRVALSYLLKQVASVDVMEQAPLRSVAASIRRRSFRLSDAVLMQRTLANCARDRDRFRLVIRIGPFSVAHWSLHPWLVQIRPSAEPLGLDTMLEQWRRANVAATGESSS
jgi:signal peptidase I